MKRKSCFGQPSIISFTSNTCGTCPQRTDCIRECYDLLQALSGQFDVSADLEHFRVNAGDIVADMKPAGDAPAQPETSQPVPTPVVDNTVRYTVAPEKLAGLPVKVAQKVRSLMQHGIDKVALAELKRGKNPFVGHPALFAAGEILLHGFDIKTATLKGELESRYKWTPGTASSRASATIGILKAIGVPLTPAEIGQGA